MVGTVACAAPCLTAREKDVFRLLVLGKTTSEAAQELFLTHNTAREYAARIYRKLGVNSRSEFMEKALALGLVAVDFRLDDPGSST